MKIERFKAYYFEYSSLNESNHYNIFQLSPLGYSWTYNEIEYHRENVEKIFSVLSGNEKFIAFVESPFSIKGNMAYIVNGINEVVWNVSNLFFEKYKHIIMNKKYIFSDVRLEKDILYFFINIDNNDFRFSFDIENGEIGRLIESR
jgi:hypothetical protein